MFDLNYAFLCLIRRLPDKKTFLFFYFHGSVVEGQKYLCKNCKKNMYGGEKYREKSFMLMTFHCKICHYFSAWL